MTDSDHIIPSINLRRTSRFLAHDQTILTLKEIVNFVDKIVLSICSHSKSNFECENIENDDASLTMKRHT